MDKIAERLAGWFGSTPFIAFHILWFTIWVALHVGAKFDPDWATLTLVVSLEAIFLSLFILRAENVQAARFEEQVRRDIKNTKHIQDMLDRRKTTKKPLK
jgi:uncharacterized membrane protein